MSTITYSQINTFVVAESSLVQIVENKYKNGRDIFASQCFNYKSNSITYYSERSKTITVKKTK